MVGDIATINDAIEVLKNKRLMWKIVEGLQKYPFCKIKFSNDMKQAWLGQPHLIKNLEKKFGRLVLDYCSHKSPSTPRFLIMSPTEENKKISTEDQQDYQLDIDTLLYLVKHLHPYLSNMTRELLKANDGANLHREFQKTLGDCLFQQ